MTTKLILDGTYSIHRAVHSQGKHLKSASGLPTAGIYIFLKMLWNFKDLGEPVVAFDWINARSPFRKNIHPEYKKRDEPKDELEKKAREETRRNLTFTYNTLRHLLPKMGIPVVVMENQEGDDVIYRLCEGISEQGNNIWVASDDKDYIQFLTLDNVKVYQPMKDKRWNRDKFLEEFGFDCKHFTLYKSIIGDSSDNILGIKGIGEKTAMKIIKEMENPSIQSLYEYANSGNKAVHKKLKDGIPLVKRNLMLIDLNNIPLTKEDVINNYNESLRSISIDVQYVVSKFKELDFKSFGNWLSYLMERAHLVQ